MQTIFGNSPGPILSENHSGQNSIWTTKSSSLLDSLYGLTLLDLSAPFKVYFYKLHGYYAAVHVKLHVKDDFSVVFFPLFEF